MTTIRKILVTASMTACAFAVAPLATAGEVAGIVKTSKGAATIERAGQKLPASVGTSVEAKDRIVTGADGAVGITLRDNTMLSAGANSVLDLNKFSFDSTTHAGAVDATIKKGTLSVISGKIAKANPDAVRFSSPSVTLGVRGTEFVLEAGDGGE